MIITEKNNYPVQYEDILVCPEYFLDYTNSEEFYSTLSQYKNDQLNYYVVGVGKSYDPRYTTVLLLGKSLDIIGVRQKISIFRKENTISSKELRAFNISEKRRIGIVICKEVLHTAIAEVYRMMGVNIVAVSIASGDFWGLQRESWIDQMTLFSDICLAPLVASCGATKAEGGINLTIER